MNTSIHICLALCFVGALSAGYTAEFPDSAGSIDFLPYDGFTQIHIEWDFSSVTGTGDEDCDVTAGYTYHIHEQWTSTSATSCSGGTDCGPDATGGHYDPIRCDVARTGYSCDVGDINTCEVGDLSGRHGKLTAVSGNFTTEDIMLIAADATILDKSVVVHCTQNGGTSVRLLGGKIVADAQLDTTATPATSFPVLTAESEGLFSFSADPNTGEMDLTLSKDGIPAEWADCTAFKYHIHSKWTSTSSTTGTGTIECGGDETGGHFDPTYACGSASEYASSDFCACSSPSYAASDLAAGYNAEFGDLSGQFNPIGTPAASGTPTTVEEADVKGLLLSEGQSIVFHCVLDGNDKNGQRAFCGKLVEASGSSKLVVSWLLLAVLAFMPNMQ